MRAPGAVQVLRAPHASRQSRRAWPPSGHVRLHSASCAVQVLWHAARALPRVAASDRPTVATRKSARRRTEITYCNLPTGVNAAAGQIGYHELLPRMVWLAARQRVPPSPRNQDVTFEGTSSTRDGTFDWTRLLGPSEAAGSLPVVRWAWHKTECFH